MNSSFIKSSSRASKEKEKKERTKWVSGEGESNIKVDKAFLAITFFLVHPFASSRNSFVSYYDIF